MQHPEMVFIVNLMEVMGKNSCMTFASQEREMHIQPFQLILWDRSKQEEVDSLHKGQIQVQNPFWRGKADFQHIQTEQL